jgi:diaminopimelate decarboxylase
MTGTINALVELVQALCKRNQTPVEQYEVVGPVCESSDCFGTSVVLPTSQRGDLVALLSAGDYDEVMASHYNLRRSGDAVYSR